MILSCRKMDEGGFTLIEVIISTALSAIILLSTYAMIGGIIRFQKNVQEEGDKTEIRGIVIQKLFSDIAFSSSYEVISQTKISLYNNGKKIEYEFKNKNIIRRDAINRVPTGGSSYYLAENGDIKSASFESVSKNLVRFYVEEISMSVALRNYKSE